MTWKRVATAVVLIPFVVGLVVWGSTAIVALAVALVTLLAPLRVTSLLAKLSGIARTDLDGRLRSPAHLSAMDCEHGYVLTRGTYTFLIYTESGLSRVLLTPHDAFFLFVLGGSGHHSLHAPAPSLRHCRQQESAAAACCWWLFHFPTRCGYMD